MTRNNVKVKLIFLIIVLFTLVQFTACKKNTFLDELPKDIRGEWQIVELMEGFYSETTPIEQLNDKLKITYNEISYNGEKYINPKIDYIENYNYYELLTAWRIKAFNLGIKPDDESIIFTILPGNDVTSDIKGMTILYSNGKMFFLGTSVYRMEKINDK